MTAMPPLRDILNDTPVDAVDVDYNFGTIESHIAAELINRDGTVAMTGDLSLARPPTAPQHATTKAYVDGNVIPIGTIWEFAGITPPAGWVFCDGTSRSKTDPAYVELFKVIGYRYGGADDTFFLPDRGARVAVGYKKDDPVAGTLGAKGGNRDATLPSHAHTQNAHGHAVTVNPESTNHYHKTRGHVHEMNHYHDSNVRPGYTVQSAPQSGQVWAALNPVKFANQADLVFLGRETAICDKTIAGGDHQNTGYVLGRPDNNYTAGPNNDTTNWVSESDGQAYTHGHGASTDAPAPVINSFGVSPTNANYPLYEVVNYMIRIG